MNIIFLGPPGAGKGTQAQMICSHMALPHISTGDILREAVKKDLPIGREAKRYMDAGELVPDEIVVKMVAERLCADDTGNGFILDGFPRTITQAGFLKKALTEIGKGIDIVVYFQTSEEVCVERLSGRRICKQCGKIYHVKNMPARAEGICDQCAGPLYQRDDDKELTVRHRFSVYQKQTKDLIDHYKGEGILFTVSGDLPAAELFTVVKARFDRLVSRT